MSIGFWELFLVLLVACIVIKPHQLPEVMGLIGSWLRKFKHVSNNVKKEWQQQVSHIEKGSYLSNEDDDSS